MKRSITSFRAGERVVIRDWDDMAEEYGLTSRGGIACRCLFTHCMKPLCSTELVIKSVDGHRVYFEQQIAPMRDFSFSTDMIRHVDDPNYSDSIYPDVPIDEFLRIIQ